MKPPLIAHSIVSFVCVAATLCATGPLANAQQPLASDALFNDETVQTIELRMHSADWEKLKQNFQENTYYPADLVFNGQTVRNVGIRSRGGGSRSGTKPGLRVDFDRYASDQSFLGLKSFVLDNLTQDPSGIHETVTMKLYRRLGIPAPREAHTRLFVSGEYVGLYAAVESIDKTFLARVFGSIGDDTQNDGYLYEYEFIAPWRFEYLGSGVDPYKQRFDAETRENESDEAHYRPIEELVRLANEVPVDQWLSAIGDRLDLTAFMRYVAAQNFVAQNDGFLGYEGVNNFYFYRLENSPRHVFIAWDEDNAFNGSLGAEFPVTARLEENVLTRKSMEVRELRDAYFAAVSEALASSEEPTGPDRLAWLEHEVRRQLDLIYDAVRADPVKPYSLEEVDGARGAMIVFAQGRRRFVRDQLTNASTRRLP